VPQNCLKLSCCFVYSGGRCGAIGQPRLSSVTTSESCWRSCCLMPACLRCARPGPRSLSVTHCYIVCCGAFGKRGFASRACSLCPARGAQSATARSKHSPSWCSSRAASSASAPSAQLIESQVWARFSPGSTKQSAGYYPCLLVLRPRHQSPSAAASFPSRRSADGHCWWRL
jgi:hypothetical protein